MPAAVIFDLDGTLLDTLEDLADSANEALTAEGLPVHPVDAYRTFVGDGIGMLIGRILPENLRGTPAETRVLQNYRQAYNRRWDAKSRPYEGIPELLDALAQRNIPSAILSNKPQAFTELCVSGLLPGHRFACVFGQRDHVPRKPDPAGALEIASALNLKPADIAFVGDTSTDMNTAVAAGMIPVGVAWGFRSVEELTASGARTILRHPLDLTRLCD